MANEVYTAVSDAIVAIAGEITAQKHNASWNRDHAAAAKDLAEAYAWLSRSDQPH